MTARSRCRYRVSLTPAGHGVLSVALPGLALAIGSGHRLLVALSLGAVLLLGVNVLLAAKAMRGLTVQVSPGPTATVGEPAEVAVQLGSTGSPLECEVSVGGGVERWSTAVAPESGELLVRHAERGLLDRLDVSTRTSIPLGLTRIERRETAVLPVAVVVAPAARDTPVPDRVPGLAGVPALSTRTSDDVDGLRPYAPGDAVRDVHWRTVARTGRLLVLDRRVPTGPGVVRMAVHGMEGAPFESALARTRSVAEHLMRAGHHLTLTVAPSHPAGTAPARPGGDPAGGTRAVGSGVELNRWLAEAAAAPLEAAGPCGPIADLDVSEDGARWRTGS